MAEKPDNSSWLTSSWLFVASSRFTWLGLGSRCVNVGFVYLLFITTVMGERKRLDLGWLSLTAMSFILTMPGWGTMVNQITGVIRESEVEGMV